nr:MAG TPA: hypothetical protein [Caudoviricetes sp.]
MWIAVERFRPTTKMHSFLHKYLCTICSKLTCYYVLLE